MQALPLVHCGSALITCCVMVEFLSFTEEGVEPVGSSALAQSNGPVSMSWPLSASDPPDPPESSLSPA